MHQSEEKQGSRELTNHPRTSADAPGPDSATAVDRSSRPDSLPAAERHAAPKAVAILPMPPEDDRRAFSRGTWLFGLVFFLVPLGYALYTGQIWEDFFITFRFSRNFALGNGLVFQAGERVHGFTSPINVLLPALFDWLGGSRSYEFPLWAFRAISAAAFAMAGVFLIKLLRQEARAGDNSLLIFAILLLLDFKAVSFSANGQETAFVLLFLALGFACVYRGPAENWRMLGASWAGLLWSRPDGCVYVAVLSIVSLLCGAGPARKQLPALARAAALCALLYLPWFLFAWAYYGTPVPHTIIAKSVGRADGLLDVALVKRVLQGLVDVAALTPAPVYANLGGWPMWVDAFCLAVGLACGVYWLVPSADRLGRMASLAYLLGCVYLSFYAATGYNGVPFPWYLPPVNLFGLVVLARAPGTVLAKLGQSRFARGAAWLVEAGLVAGMAAIFLMGCYQMRIQQREIELGVRVPVGLWLAENVAPSETVYTEALGYFGFFSQCHMLDGPGLVSPSVVQARRKGHNDFFYVIAALMPDWLVLRGPAVAYAARSQAFQADYEVAKVFKASPLLSAYASIPGFSYLKLDDTFVILKRKHKPSSGHATDVAP
jgi:hypothetical protein